MKIMMVSTSWITHTIYIADHAKADAAYDVLQSAMDSYDKYSNDTDKTVSIDTGAGVSTYRIDILTAISLDDLTTSEATVIEREVWKRTLEVKIAARLAPAT